MQSDLGFSMAAVQREQNDLVFDVMVANYKKVIAGINISPAGVVTREADSATYKFDVKGVDDFADVDQYHMRLCATKYNPITKKRDVVAYKDATVPQIESVWDDIKADERVFYFFDGVKYLKDSDGIAHVNPDDPSMIIKVDVSSYRGFVLSIANLQLEDKCMNFPDLQFTVPGGTIPFNSLCVEVLNHADWNVIKTRSDLFTTEISKYNSAMHFWDYYQSVAEEHYKAGSVLTKYKDDHATSSQSVTLDVDIPLKTATVQQMDDKWFFIENYSDAFGTEAKYYGTYTAYKKAIDALPGAGNTYDKSSTSTEEATIETTTTKIVTNTLKYLKKLAYSPDAPWALYPGELSTDLTLTPNKTWSVPTENVDAYPRGDQIVVVNGGDASDQTGLLYWDRVPTNFTGAQAYFMELVD